MSRSSLTHPKAHEDEQRAFILITSESGNVSFGEFKRIELHRQQVDSEQTGSGRSVGSNQLLYCLGSLQRGYCGGCGSDNTGNFTRHHRYVGLGRRKDVGESDGCGLSGKGHDLPFPSGHTSDTSRPAESPAEFVSHILGSGIVGGIDDIGVIGQYCLRVLQTYQTVIGVDRDFGIQLAHTRGESLDLLFSGISFRVEELALKIREVDGVEIGDSDASDTGGSQQHGHLSAQRAASYDENGGGRETLLSLGSYT